MSEVEIRFGCRAYDPIAPLLLGEVPVEGVRFRWCPTPEIGNAKNELLSDDPALPNVAEMSFNRYVADYAKGDTKIMGFPAFVLKGFRQRFWFVRQDSPLETFADLRGKRVGNDSWNDSGNMWARAAMRDAGVDLPEVEWTIGKISDAFVAKPKFATDSQPPGDYQQLAPEDNLIDALRERRIDVLTTARTPPSVFERNGEFRRLLRNYGEVERAFFQRKRYRPAMHMIAVKRSFGEQNPAAMLALQKAMKASWNHWWTRYIRWPEATPWSVEDVESYVRDYADEMCPYGLSPAQQRMVEAICQEQYEQKLVSQAAKPEALFAAFHALK